MQPSRVASSDKAVKVKATAIGFGLEAVLLVLMISDLPVLSSIAGFSQLPSAMLALLFLSNDPGAKWVFVLYLFVTQGSLYAWGFAWLLKTARTKEEPRAVTE